MTREQRANRHALGRIMVFVFLSMQAAANYLLNYSVIFGTDVLSDKEKEYMHKLVTIINKDADRIRAFGKRLEK